MQKKKNVLFIFIIVVAILLIFTVIIVFNRRIRNIEAKQEKGLKTAYILLKLYLPFYAVDVFTNNRNLRK